MNKYICHFWYQNTTKINQKQCQSDFIPLLYYLDVNIVAFFSASIIENNCLKSLALERPCYFIRALLSSLCFILVTSSTIYILHNFNMILLFVFKYLMTMAMLDSFRQQQNALCCMFNCSYCVLFRSGGFLELTLSHVSQSGHHF